MRREVHVRAQFIENVLGQFIAELIKDAVKPRPTTTERDVRALRAEVLALTRALHTGLGKLERMQTRAAKDAEVSETEVQAGPPSAHPEPASPEPEVPPALAAPAASTAAAVPAAQPREAVEQRAAAWIQRRTDAEASRRTR